MAIIVEHKKIDTHKYYLQNEIRLLGSIKYIFLQIKLGRNSIHSQIHRCNVKCLYNFGYGASITINKLLIKGAGEFFRNSIYG